MSNGVYWYHLAAVFGQPNGDCSALHVSGFSSRQSLARIEAGNLRGDYHYASAVAGRLFTSRYPEVRGFGTDWHLWQNVVAHWTVSEMKNTFRDGARRAMIVEERLVWLTPYPAYPVRVEIYSQAPAEVVNLLIHQINSAPGPDSFSVPNPWEVSRRVCLALALAELTEPTPDTKPDTPKKSSVSFPQSQKLLSFCHKLKRDLRPGVRQIDVALDFANGDKAKAESLLRQANRYPHLWKYGPGDN